MSKERRIIVTCPICHKERSIEYYYGRARSTIRICNSCAVRKTGLAGKGRKQTEEAREKNRLGHIGLKASEETKRKLYLLHKGSKRPKETGEKIRLSKLGKPRSEETRQKLSLANIGKILTEETKLKLSILSKKFHDSMTPEQKAAYVRKVILSQNRRPNKPEASLLKLLDNACPNEYKYTGDGKVVICGLVPDFTNINGQKKVIELYGDYWHRGEDPQERIDRYSSFGFGCLVIWEHELKDNMILKKKILEFVEGHK